MLICVRSTVYANSFLAMMNARRSLRDTLSQPIDLEINLGNTLRFDYSASTVGSSPGGHKNSHSHSQVSDGACRYCQSRLLTTLASLSLVRCGIADISSLYKQSDRIHAISSVSWHSGGWLIHSLIGLWWRYWPVMIHQNHDTSIGEQVVWTM